MGNRADYRKGGRVKFHVGLGAVHEREQGVFIPHNPSLPSHDTTNVGGGGNGPGSGSGSSGPAVGETRTNDDGTISIYNGTAWVKQGSGAGEYNPSDQEVFDDKRGKRIIKAGDAAEDIAAGKLPENLPTGTAEKINRGLYTEEDINTTWQKGGRGGTISKNEQGHTAKDILEGLSSENPEFSQYELTDAQALIQAEQKLIGQSDPDSPFNTESTAVQMGDPTDVVGTEVATTPAEEVATMQATTSDAPADVEAAKTTAATISDSPEVQAALGELSEGSLAKVEEIRNLSGPAVAAQISQQITDAAKAKNIDAVISAGAFVPEVTGVGAQVSESTEAEQKSREAITGQAASGTEAQIIDSVGYEAAQQRAVKGTAAQGAAANMLAQTAAIPENIAAAIVEDPATMTAQIANEDVEVQAAVAALPTEALVSSQMESLLGGMENGTIPAWAKPAVDAVNQGMASRGLDISTVGRDALFNSIIQSAMPMAQSNAQALQQRAAQNLSNEQQANLQEATQEQQLRLQNLANRQDAASQTAQMSQQMKTLQSQFNQQAVMTSADQQQQTRTQNLQNQQQAAMSNVQNQQQANMQNLGNEQQLNMTELQIEANVEGANQSAVNQERMAEMQVAADFLAKNAALKQDMEKANLSSDQQMRLANLSAQNQAGSENLSAAQQTELANLSAQMQLNIKNAELAQAMGVAQLSVDQQRAMQNAGMVANMDMSKFNAAQQVELANSKWMQSAAVTNMSAEQQSIMQNATALASLDLATLDQRTKIAAQNAQAFLQMDVSNLNNEQQANMMTAQQEQQRLLSNQAATNASRQFNAASENQTNQFMASLGAQVDQFNVAQLNAAEQFNTQSTNAAEARDANRTADVNKANAAILNQTSQFNAQLDFNRNQWNAQNEQAVAQSNVTWRRQANMADTAAANAINQQNVQNAFGLTSSAQSFLWQELRDQADYDFRFANDSASRRTQAAIAAASAEGDAATNWSTNFNNIANSVSTMFGD